MSIITLTTDWGLKDHFVAAFKGRLLSRIKDVVIVDISHGIEFFNTAQAGYCIAAAYYNFPEESIHIIDVDSEQTADIKHVAMRWNNHFFIGTDNGTFSALTQKQPPQELVEITLHKKLKNASAMNVFTETACHIAQGGKLNEIGIQLSDLKTVTKLKPFSNENTITGNIIYIDNFGNCVTNIAQSFFHEIGKGRNFEIKFGATTHLYGKQNIITKLNKNYSDFEITGKLRQTDFEGIKLALFNEEDYLEIAIYKSNPKTTGSARSLFGLQYGDMVLVEFSG